MTSEQAEGAAVVPAPRVPPGAGGVPSGVPETTPSTPTDGPLLALIVAETDMRLFSDPFLDRVLASVHAEADLRGARLMFSLSRQDGDADEVRDLLLRHHVDGALLVSLHGGALRHLLESSRVPVVTAGRVAQSSKRLEWWVDADNRGGAQLAVTHLRRRGRRTIATISGPLDMSAGADRLEGWREASGYEGRIAASLTAVGDFTPRSGYQAMQSLLRDVPSLDAVFAASDPMALGAMQALADAGLRVPDDVAVVGFDDAPEAEKADPPLTTVRQSVSMLSATMVDLLLGRLSGEATDPHVLVPTELIVRASS